DPAPRAARSRPAAAERLPGAPRPAARRRAGLDHDHHRVARDPLGLTPFRYGSSPRRKPGSRLTGSDTRHAAPGSRLSAGMTGRGALQSGPTPPEARRLTPTRRVARLREIGALRLLAQAAGQELAAALERGIGGGGEMRVD